MSANTKALSNILGIPQQPQAIAPLPAEEINPTVERSDKSLNLDFDYARSNLYELINTGKSALDELLEVARQSQHPRAYEVASNMLTHLVDANKKLLDLTKQVRDIESSKKSDEPGDSSTKVQQNNLFVGSTAELLKLIRGGDTGKVIDGDE